MFPKMYIFALVEEQSENIESIIRHLRESSDQNYVTMQNLLRSKDYSWAFFLDHLLIEKLLKAHSIRSMLFSHMTCSG
jgi:hypothetical protein